MMTSPSMPSPQRLKDVQRTDAKLSHFHHAVRWYYRIVFGFLIAGILGSAVEGFFWERFVIGNWAFRPFEKYYIIQLALQYPLYFYPLTIVFVGLGILGFTYDTRFTRMKKASEHEHLKNTVDQVLEGKGPDMIQNAVEKSIDQDTRIREAVRRGIEDTGVLKSVVKKGVEEVLKDVDTVSGALKNETSVKIPMDIAILPLPPAASGLVGREKDQEWLEACIAAGKIVGISGMGGVGKTTLVADTLNKVASQFHSGGIAVVVANDVTNRATILRQLVEKFVPNGQELLSRSDTKLPILSEALSHTLRERCNEGDQVLIVMDSIEPKLIKEDSLEDLCDIFRSVKASVVITAHERLSGRLVHERRELDVFTNEDANALLTKLLLHSLGRPLGDLERHDIAEICDIVGNHAQAIVLINAYFEYHPQASLATYLQQLKDTPRIVLDLTNRLRASEASRGVRLTFANSYSQLEEVAQQLFVALGALTGRSCTSQAVQALGSALHQSEDDTQANLEALIRSKLVLNPPTDVSGMIDRVYLHPLVQEFAHELLRTSPDILEDTVYEALAVHYAEWVQKASEDMLSDDEANIIAALRWAKAHLPQADIALAKLVYSLRWYWHRQLQFAEAFTWINLGCEVMERLGSKWNEQRGQLMFAMGAQYQWRGEMRWAENWYTKSLKIFRKIKSQVGTGEPLSGLAALALQKGETEEARSSYEKSLAIFRKARDQRGEADSLYRLGVLALGIGDIDAALQYYTDSLNIRRLGIRNDQWGEGVIFYSLGNVYQQIGDVNKALNHYIDGLEICQKVGNRRGEGTVLKALGDLALQTSGPADAERYLTQSLTIFDEIFDLQSKGVTLYSFGFLHRQTGNIDEARKSYNDSLEIREKVKDERGRSFVLKGLGDLARRTGDMQTSKKQLEDSLSISKKVNDRRNEAVVLKALGDWSWQNGDLIAARDYYLKSLEIRKNYHDLWGEAITLKALGDLALKEGDKTVANDYLKQSLIIFREVQYQRGEGVTLHSLGILALAEGDKSVAREHLEQSLQLILKSQDRQSEGAVLSSLAMLYEAQGDLLISEKEYRDSVHIANELQVENNIAVSQEVLGDFLLRRYGQIGKEEGKLRMVKAAETYRRLDQHDAAERVEEQRVGRYRTPERDRIIRALIYDLDEGPNGMSTTSILHQQVQAGMTSKALYR